jgi:hypothetical protein
VHREPLPSSSGERDPLATLAATPVGVTSPAELERERSRLLPWLEAEVRALPARRAEAERRARRSARLAWGLGLAAAAGLSLMVGALWRRSAEPVASAPPALAKPQKSEGPGLTLLSGRLESGPLELLPGSRVATSSALGTAPDAEARLRGAEGYELRLGPASRVTVAPSSPAAAERTTEIHLARGLVALEVPKLPHGAALVVVTEDARVRVVGTRFSVELQEAAEGAARGVSCVRVEEGRVEVLRAPRDVRVLGPGESSGCEASAAGPASADEAREAPGPAGAARAAPRRDTPSALAAQNRLLAEALAAERRGDTLRARAAYSRLLREHPDSPFDPEARAGLARLERAPAGR